MSDRAPPRGRARRAACGAALASVVGGALACAASAAPIERPSIGTMRVAKACITETVRVTGFAVARGERRLALPMPGYRISEVLVSEGDAVAASQDLIRAVPTDPGPAATAAPAVLRAPAAGTVTQLAAAAGDLTGAASAGQPLLTITTDAAIDVVVDVPSPFAARIRRGAGARVRGLHGADAGATVKDPVSTVNPATQLGQARVAVDAASHLRPGQFASVRIEVGRECRVTIPQAAVTLKDGVASVQVLDGATLERRTIVTGLSDDTDVQVREGLSEGDVVVASAGSGVEGLPADALSGPPAAPAKP